MRRKRARLSVALALACGAAFAMTPARAGSLTPLPPAGFTCSANGHGTTCSRSFIRTETAFPIGIDCGAFQVLENGLFEVSARWIYDQDGNLVEIFRHINQPLAGDANIWYNPLNGKSVAQVGDVNVVTDFETPGNVLSGITTQTGLGGKVVVPGAGVIFIDVGRIVIAADTILEEAGPHMFFDGDFGSVCAFLS